MLHSPQMCTYSDTAPDACGRAVNNRPGLQCDIMKDTRHLWYSKGPVTMKLADLKAQTVNSQYFNRSDV